MSATRFGKIIHLFECEKIFAANFSKFRDFSKISDFSIELVFLAATAAYFYSSSPKDINSGSKIGFLQAVLETFSHFLTLLWQFYRKRHTIDKKLLIYSYIDPNFAVNKSEFLRDKN